MALVEVAERGGAFVPADRLLQDEPWWEVGPFLLPESLKDGYRLTHWMPGRVEVAGKEQIEFRVAKVAAGVVEDIRRLTVDNDLLAAWNWEAEGKLQCELSARVRAFGETTHRRRAQLLAASWSL